MGYTTKFTRKIKIDPPLNKQEREFLIKFSETRRMNRTKGPYYVDGSGDYGQAHENDVINHNHPPDGQPGLWCSWIPSGKGDAIKWDGVEKFYKADKWMEYIINHFIGQNPKAKSELPFLEGHKCNGVIRAYGEESYDRWLLFVSDNVVTTMDLTKEKFEWIKENNVNLRTQEGLMALKLRFC